jgi:molecular chaperone IbpA
MADYVKVASADLVNGLLSIDLVREIPEAMRPRQIQIGASAQKAEQIEQKAA